MVRKTFNGNISITLPLSEFIKSTQHMQFDDASKYYNCDNELYDNFIINDRNIENNKKQIYTFDVVCKTNIRHAIGFIGRNSMEIYILHGFVLHGLQLASKIKLANLYGLVVSVVIVSISVTICLIIEYIIKANTYMNLILFTK